MAKTLNIQTEWTEIEPATFERRNFSAEELAKWDRRPDELIKSALHPSSKARDEKSSGQ